MHGTDTVPSISTSCFGRKERAYAVFHRRRQPACRHHSEVGGRTWSRSPVLTETKGGSKGKALGRMISGESLFLNHYTAQGPAEIAFSSSFPGRIRIPVQDDPWA